MPQNNKVGETESLSHPEGTPLGLAEINGSRNPNEKGVLGCKEGKKDDQLGRAALGILVNHCKGAG